MDLLTIISGVDNTSAILELNKRFEQCGLTVQQAPSGKIFICRIDEGKPGQSNLYEDHFPVGMPNRPLSDRVIEAIVEWVKANKNEPQEIAKDSGRPGNYGLYGTSVYSNRFDTELMAAIDDFLNG